MTKLTKRIVDAALPGPRISFVWDEQLRGFGLRITPAGVKSYIVQYRTESGRSRRLTIGRHGVLTVDEGRKRALDILAVVARGGDPAQERTQTRRAPTVSDLLDQYIAEHVEKRNQPSTIAEVKRLVRLHIRPRLGRLKVAAVARQDLARLHGAMAATPRQANFVLAVCSKAFNLAETWGMRPEGTNPCQKIERYPEVLRERFLSDGELIQLGETLRLAETTGLPWVFPAGKVVSKHVAKPENRRTPVAWQAVAAIRLLLFTGCRLGEVVSMRWDRIDPEAGTLSLDQTKAGKRQKVVLNAPALDLLETVARRVQSSWVLPMRGDPNRHISSSAIERAWQGIRAAADLEDVRLHDLRYTVGTFAGQAGTNAFAVRDLLRHATVAMTGRYVSRDEDPLRRLSDEVGGRIAANLNATIGSDSD